MDVWWAKYHYALGLNYSEAGGVKSVEGLGVSLHNWALYSYNVQGGEYEGGMSDIGRTDLRVERIDLVEVDERRQRYRGTLLARRQHLVRQPARWQHDRGIVLDRRDAGELEQCRHPHLFAGGPVRPQQARVNYWAPWAPPVAVASLNGSGSAAGSDYQCILWRLNSNQVEIIKSAPYYADAVEGTGLLVTSPQCRRARQPGRAPGRRDRQPQLSLSAAGLRGYTLCGRRERLWGHGQAGVRGGVRPALQSHLLAGAERPGRAGFPGAVWRLDGAHADTGDHQRQWPSHRCCRGAPGRQQRDHAGPAGAHHLQPADFGHQHGAGPLRRVAG